MTHLDHLVFELTQACNQRCRFCYNYWRDGASPVPPPDPRLARRTLRKLFSQASVGTISFSGGEPTLLRNVHDLALTARFKGSRVNLLTNGTLLTADAIDNFRRIGVGAIQIPILSADPAVHDALTGLPGSWAKATDALRRVVAAMPEGAVAVLVITRVNAPGLDKTLSLLDEIGVKTVMVNRFNIGGLGLRHAHDLILNRHDLRAAFATVERIAAAAAAAAAASAAPAASATSVFASAESAATAASTRAGCASTASAASAHAEGVGSVLDASAGASSAAPVAIGRRVIRFVSGVCTPVCLLEPRDYPHIRFTACSTDFNRRPVALSCTGDVRFCNHSPHVLGNIYDRPIGEILSDPATTARYAAVPDACRACRDLARCNGGCRAASEQVYGDFARIDPVLDAAQ